MDQEQFETKSQLGNRREVLSVLARPGVLTLSCYARGPREVSEGGQKRAGTTEALPGNAVVRSGSLAMSRYCIFQTREHRPMEAVCPRKVVVENT